MAQHTRARMADRGCCRPRRLRGSGTVARKESRLPERNASMRLLREVLPGENRTSWPTDFLLFAQAQSVNSPDARPGRFEFGGLRPQVWSAESSFTISGHK